MNLDELESFKLSDAVKFHDSLNPALWTKNNELDPEVYNKLIEIAKDFITELGLSSLKVDDITISGSNAAYSYTPHSDLDLHILVDYNKLPDNEVYKELFNAKKTVYNDKHDIKVHGVPVELYVQDSNQPHTSLGEYSLLKKEWNKFPVKRRANFDHASTKLKYEKLGNLIEIALKSKNLDDVNRVLDIIKRYRKAGLERTGEFGPENLAFKAIRKQGLFQKLWDYKQDLRSKELSIENINEILDKESAAEVYWSKENYMTDAPVSQMYTTHTAAARDKNKNILKYNFYDFPKHDLTAIEFSRAVGPWGDNFSIDNAGDQYTVFATLVKTIQEYLSDHKPKFISFGAKEPSRAKLYQTFVNRFASKFGYKQISPDNIPKSVQSILFNRGDTPFLLQKVGSEPVKESVKYIEGTNCKNCVWWKKDSEKPVGKDELNKYGGLKPPNKEYIAMSKRVDLVTLPGKDTVKEKGFCYHKDINDWVTERMCCAKWDGKGVLRDYKGESPLMEAKAEAVRKIQKFLNKKYDANLDVDGVLGPLTLKSINKFMPKANKAGAPEPDKTTSVQGKQVKEVLDTEPGKTNKAKWDFSDTDMQELNFTASNGQQYRLDFLAPYIGPDEINQYKLLPDASDKYLDHGFFVQFEQVNKRSPWKQGKQGIEGTGAAAEIFGIVSNAILQFVKKKKPTYLYFQAAESNRISLYSAMIKRLLPNLPGWKAQGPTSDGVFMLYSPVKKVTKEASGTIPESEYFFSMEFDPKIKKKILATKINNPTASCQLESKRWAKLLNKAGYEVEIHHGFYYPEHDLDDPEGHTWLEVEGSIFDPTAWLFSDKGHGEYQTHETEDLNEASGYIPSKKEKNDPRYKTALTVDVKPNSIKKNAKAFGWKVNRTGRPPLLRK